MAGVFFESILSESAESGKPEKTLKIGRNEKSWRLFKWFMVIAALVLGAELIWFLGVTPFRPFSRIEISGFTYYDRDSLLRYAGLTSESSFIFTDTNAIETLISELPQIESVRVFKRFPGRLEINLQSRSAAAFAFASAGELTVPVLFDRQGVIFQIGAGRLADSVSGLPVISGLLIENPVAGMQLPARFFSFLEDLDTIRINSPELLSAVSEIRIDQQSPEGFDLTLFLQHRKIKILLSGLSEEILRYTLLMADVLSEREPDIGMIDFRGAVASYYPKGGYL